MLDKFSQAIMKAGKSRSWMGTTRARIAGAQLLDEQVDTGEGLGGWHGMDAFLSGAKSPWYI